MIAMRLAVCAFVLGIAACTPYAGGGAYHCENDTQCAGGPGGGRCEMLNGLCSFTDLDCTSGQRYGTSAGTLSGVCVGDEPPIDAAIDASIDTPDGYIADARQCFGTPIMVCLTAVPTTPYNAPAAINTSSDCQQVIAQANGPDLCVNAGTTVSVPATTVA